MKFIYLWKIFSKICWIKDRNYGYTSVQEDKLLNWLFNIKSFDLREIFVCYKLKVHYKFVVNQLNFCLWMFGSESEIVKKGMGNIWFILGTLKNHQCKNLVWNVKLSRVFNNNLYRWFTILLIKFHINSYCK